MSRPTQTNLDPNKVLSDDDRNWLVGEACSLFADMCVEKYGPCKDGKLYSHQYQGIKDGLLAQATRIKLAELDQKKATEKADAKHSAE